MQHTQQMQNTMGKTAQERDRRWFGKRSFCYRNKFPIVLLFIYLSS